MTRIDFQHLNGENYVRAALFILALERCCRLMADYDSALKTQDDALLKECRDRAEGLMSYTDDAKKILAISNHLNKIFEK